MTAPTLIDIPFASSGDVVTIPDTVQPSGAVSFPQGYGVQYQTPTGSGGFNIERTKFNYLMNVVTTALSQYQYNGVPDYYAAISAGAGYAKGARVNISGVIYRSLEDANPDAPVGSANWAVDYVPVITHQAVSAVGKTYAVSDWGNLIQRDNSGTAMSDTLPGTSGALPDGENFFIKNADSTATITVAVGAGGTIKQGNLTGNIIIFPGETWLIESQGSGVYNAGRIMAALLHSAPPQGEFKNLKIITQSSSVAAITADALVLQDANGNTRRVLSVSQNYDTTVSGAGGIDSGSIAGSTWYYEYIILNPTTNTKAALLSTSPTSPTLPSGYTYFARVGATYSNVSSILIPKVQYGKDVQYPTPIQLASGIATNAAVSISAVVPTTASRIKVYVNQSGTSSPITCGVAPNSNWSAQTPQYPIGGASASTTPVNAVWQGEMLLESSNIYWYAGASQCKLLMYGYTDNL